MTRLTLSQIICAPNSLTKQNTFLLHHHVAPLPRSDEEDKLRVFVNLEVGVSLLDINANSQQSFSASPTGKLFSCIAVSPDGKCLACGEIGNDSHIIVFSIQRNEILFRFPNAHVGGITCLAFSPDSNYLVSVGFEEDASIKIWEMKTQKFFGVSKLIESEKKTHSISFASDGSYFITCGHNHINYWNFDAISRKSREQSQFPIIFEKKAFVLKSHKDSVFYDVQCSFNNTKTLYALSETKLFVLNVETRTISKWVDVTPTNGFAVNNELVLTCQNKGPLLMFDAESLQFVEQFRCSPLQKTKNEYPDHLYCCVYLDSKHFIVMNSDFTLSAFKRAGKTNTLVSQFPVHIGSISDAKTFPTAQHSFVTSSEDGSIRIFDVKAHSVIQKQIILNREHYTTLLRPDNSQTTTEKKKPTGILSLSVRCDGKHICAGDSIGNVHIVSTDTWETRVLFAHAREVLCCAYSDPRSISERNNRQLPSSRQILLATGSADRLIHVYLAGTLGDNGIQYGLIHTLDDHRGTIRSLSFANYNGLRLASTSSSDENSENTKESLLIIRSVDKGPKFAIKKLKSVTSTIETMNSLTVDRTERLFVTSGVERKLGLYSVENGLSIRSHKAHEGNVVRIAVDKNGLTIAVSFTAHNANTVRLYDFFSGDLIDELGGFPTLVSGLCFDSAGTTLVCTTMNGGVYLYTLERQNTSTDRTKQQKSPPKETPTDLVANFTDLNSIEENNSPIVKINKNLLPSWAVTKGGKFERHKSSNVPQGVWMNRVQQSQEVATVNSVEFGQIPFFPKVLDQPDEPSFGNILNTSDQSIAVLSPIRESCTSTFERTIKANGDGSSAAELGLEDIDGNESVNKVISEPQNASSVRPTNSFSDVLVKSSKNSPEKSAQGTDIEMGDDDRTEYYVPMKTEDEPRKSQELHVLKEETNIPVKNEVSPLEILPTPHTQANIAQLFSIAFAELKTQIEQKNVNTLNKNDPTRNSLLQLLNEVRVEADNLVAQFEPLSAEKILEDALAKYSAIKKQ